MCDIHRSVFLGFHHVQLSMNINTVAACRTVVGSLGPHPCLFLLLIDRFAVSTIAQVRVPKCGYAQTLGPGGIKFIYSIS